MTIRATRVEGIKRVYPHVNEIEDWRAAQSVRLLWDRIHDLEERLQAAQTTIASLVDGHNTNEASVATANQNARMALSVSQRQAVGGTLVGGSGGGGGGGEELPGGGDSGGGSEGCAAAGATGHDSGGLLNAVRAGQIVCGTAHEFPALLNAVATSEIRQANFEQLLRRMIWHLKQAGFTAGRQRNPSGAISQDKLTVVVDSVLRAYDVFSGGPPDAPASTHMNEVAPPDLVDDAGIPD